MSEGSDTLGGVIRKARRRLIRDDWLWPADVVLTVALFIAALTARPGIDWAKSAHNHGTWSSVAAVAISVFVALVFSAVLAGFLTWFVLGGIRGVSRWVTHPHPRLRSAPPALRELQREHRQRGEDRNQLENPPGSWDPGPP